MDARTAVALAGAIVTVALAAAGAPAAGAASPSHAALPPKPVISPSGGGGNEGGEGEGEAPESRSTTARTSSVPTAPGPRAGAALMLPPPAAWVVRLQVKLHALGYFSGPDTGVYGPLTTAAVTRFQQANGLVPDGRWGPASQARLVLRSSGR